MGCSFLSAQDGVAYWETGGPQVADSPQCYPQSGGPAVSQGTVFLSTGCGGTREANPAARAEGDPVLLVPKPPHPRALVGSPSSVERGGSQPHGHLIAGGLPVPLCPSVPPTLRGINDQPKCCQKI